MKTGRLTKIINAIDYSVSTPRHYIGASSIGGECSRQIWYEFKNIVNSDVPVRLSRTWDIGKKLEGLVIEWLQKSGLNIMPYSPDLEDKEFDFFQGHVDAILFSKDDKAQSIIEIKTANDSSFKLFVKHGCKKWNFKYYCQIQAYMGMSGIFNAYILVLNKDNSEIFDENILFDKHCYEDLKEKAHKIYYAEEPPNRISNNPTWYICKNCKYRKVCHK